MSTVPRYAGFDLGEAAGQALRLEVLLEPGLSQHGQGQEKDEDDERLAHADSHFQYRLDTTASGTSPSVGGTAWHHLLRADCRPLDLRALNKPNQRDDVPPV